MEQPKYKEQLDRVRRWYQRFQEIAEGKLHIRSSDFYQDEVYAFFMNCYHLKDWIKNDPAAATLAIEVEDLINQSPELSICADICNGHKHLKLNHPRSNQNPQFGNRLFKVRLGTDPKMIAVSYSINTTDGLKDAFELATKCLNTWEKFIEGNKNRENND